MGNIPYPGFSDLHLCIRTANLPRIYHRDLQDGNVSVCWKKPDGPIPDRPWRVVAAKPWLLLAGWQKGRPRCCMACL